MITSKSGTLDLIDCRKTFWKVFSSPDKGFFMLDSVVIIEQASNLELFWQKFFSCQPFYSTSLFLARFTAAPLVFR